MRERYAPIHFLLLAFLLFAAAVLLSCTKKSSTPFETKPHLPAINIDDKKFDIPLTLKKHKNQGKTINTTYLELNTFHKAIAFDPETAEFGLSLGPQYIENAIRNALYNVPSGHLLFIDNNFVYPKYNHIDKLDLYNYLDRHSINPILIRNQDAHSSRISDCATTKNGDLILTASFDKTARLTTADTGTLKAVLRPPRLSELEGELYACALSPDGKLAAVGGYTGVRWEGYFSVYIFNTDTQSIVKRIKNLPASVKSLAFSADGKFLAVGCSGGRGVWVYDLWKNETLLGDKIFSKDLLFTQFTSYGHLIAADRSGRIIVYDEKFNKIHEKNPSKDNELSAAALSPDETRLAVAHIGSSTVEIRSVPSMKLIRKCDGQQKPESRIFDMVWDKEGTNLYLGESETDSGRISLMNTASGEMVRTLYDGQDGVLALERLPGGQVVFGTSHAAIGVITHNMINIISKNPKWDSRSVVSPPDNFRSSQDLSVVQIYSGHNPSDALFFDAVDKHFLRKDQLSDQVFPPRINSKGTQTSNWISSITPVLPYPNDRPSCNKKSFAFSKNGKRIVSGSECILRPFDEKGISKGWIETGLVEVIHVSADGEKCVTLQRDGTIRWYNTVPMKETLALLIHEDGMRWAMWTPEGFFDHSPGGEKLIAFHLNRGKDTAGLTVSSDRLYKQFHRPDLVQTAIAAGVQNKTKNALAALGNVKDILHRVLPPKIHFISFAEGPANPRNDKQTVQIHLIDLGGGVGRVEIYLDGLPVGEEYPGNKWVHREMTVEHTLDIPPGNHQIQVIAYDRKNELGSWTDWRGRIGRSCVLPPN